MIGKVVVAGIVILWALASYAMFGYMLYKYIIHPGDWNLLPGTCCELIQWLPLYGHIIGASIMILFGPIQMLRLISKRGQCCHKYTGGIYIAGAILSSFSGILFMNFNATVGGQSMTVPFTVSGMVIFVFAIMTLVSGIYNRKADHKMWLFRMYFVGTSSVFYRVLYLITYVIRGHHHITFQEPLDMAFNWLFFIIPMFLVEIGLLISTRLKSCNKYRGQVILPIDYALSSEQYIERGDVNFV